MANTSVSLTGAKATTAAGSINKTNIVPITVSINQSYSGANYIDNRTTFYNLSNITLGSGGFTNSQWYTDAGPIGMSTALLEQRSFCLQGNATFTFTGTKLVVRVNTAYSWYTGATVTIDGVAPSTIAGLSVASNFLSCDSATYGLFTDAYVDVVIANGLTNTLHTAVITVNSTNPAQFFSIVGYKVGSATSLPIARPGGWIVPDADLISQNLTAITMTNQGNYTVANPTLTFPASMVDDTDSTLSPLTAASLGPNQILSQAIIPVFSGNEVSGTFPLSMTLSAQYQDPHGVLTQTVPINAYVGDPAYTVTGTWFKDFLTPTAQERIYSDADPATAWIQLNFVNDSLALTVESSAGFGDIGVYASNNSTLLHTVTGSTGGGTLVTTTMTGFGAGNHTVFLKKVANDGTFIVIVSAQWNFTGTYTQLTETVVLNFQAQQPYAMQVQGLAVNGLNVSFDIPVLGTTDLVDTPVRENTSLAYTEILTRFPTFAVCYLTGYRDILSQYDRLIVDPLAVHAADVIHWQNLGIQVFGYISSGEETGTYSNRYDFSSSLAPWPGAGAGGFATYYMDTQNAPNPDQDGVWSSYYINPDPTKGWPTRVQDWYIPQCIGGPVTVTNEVVTVGTATIPIGSVFVFDTAASPIDIDQPITLTTLDEVTTYVEYQDFTFNVRTGAFVLSQTINPAVTNGQQLLISYTRKGHNMDGIFWDTVDTPDVYGGNFPPFPLVNGYAALYTTMFNTWATSNPGVPFISNRGFTILPNIIQNCVGVMFESNLTLPTNIGNLNTTGYAQITDPATIAVNAGFDALLRTLRQTNTFDVYSLNYCSPPPAGAALQLYCREQDAERGYLSWQSTITLTSPGSNSVIKTSGIPPANSPIGTPNFPITTNDFVRVLYQPITTGS